VPARPQRRRQDDDALHALRPHPAHVRHRVPLRPRHVCGPGHHPREPRRVPAARRAVAGADGERAPHAVRRHQGRAEQGRQGRVRQGAGDGRPDGEGRRRGPHALRRHEAQAVRLPRLPRRLQGRVPRRADVRRRPVQVRGSGGASQRCGGRPRLSCRHCRALLLSPERRPTPHLPLSPATPPPAFPPARPAAAAPCGTSCRTRARAA
jgi:hypothetical protein